VFIDHHRQRGPVCALRACLQGWPGRSGFFPLRFLVCPSWCCWAWP